MPDRTPEYIASWLDKNLHRFDNPSQWLGTEPGSARKPWDQTSVRWLVAASWPYYHGTGNQSIPAVCATINRNPGFYADRAYLPETPRDLRSLERAGIPVFGIESRHQARDFDLIGTSISYAVLWMNFCNTGEAPIWMADKTFKPLSKIQAGDEVMGWEWPSTGKHRRLRRTRVLGVMSRQAQVVKVTMESGKVIRCTPDHQWLAGSGWTPPGTGRMDKWTHVGGASTRYETRQLGDPSRYGENRIIKPGDSTVRLGVLSTVVDISPELTPEQQREADWLAGMYDGEGHANQIAQSYSHNPEVCGRIERALAVLNIPYYRYTNKKSSVHSYYMAGGKQTYLNWLNWTNGVKREWFERKLDDGHLMKRPDRVVKIETDGVDTVYSMETETGNYVAWGLASKNCKMVRMSGIPLRWRDREANAGDYPMLVAGGQAYCAPGFMEPVADCIFLGEVEDEPGNGGLSQVCARIAQFKAEGSWHAERAGCYERLAREFNYLFFPRFVETLYRYEDRALPEPSKQVSGYRSLLPGMRMPFRSRTVKNMDNIKPLTEAPLLYADPRMGAGDLEVARSCPAWCSFCRLSWVSKPYRQRSVEKSVEHAAEWQRNMGSVELSPFSPDFPMHTRKKELLTALLESVNSSLDVTAMRIDDFNADDQYVLIQAHAGADGVTLGLEGNSQRMRDLVGKGTADKDAVEAVTRGIRAGFRKFKLFMITNFPGEESGDVMRIVELARRLAAVRDELGQPHVVLQFSWTPLLIEAQTPFQWFAPTPPDHTLIKVAEEFRDLGVQFKLGTKVEPNKIALFQLCQRASRDVGEAITDVFEELDTACWGGVPKDTRDRLEAALRRRGFRNGLADCFDERGQYDLFGWEYIQTGVSPDLMWDVYRQMVEFLEGTDAETYESQFAGHEGGNEWIARCDEKCMGNACGACDKEDLKLRASYIRDVDQDIDLAKVKVIDQSSVALKVRVRFEVPPENRFVTREHWKYAIRRAAYRAAHDMDWKTGISKKTVQLASDACKHRDWACGVDYAEFGLAWRPSWTELKAFLANMAAELAPWLEVPWVQGDRGRGDWDVFPADASVRRDAAFALWELEPPAGPDEVTARLRDFAAADYVKLVIRSDSAYFGAGAEEVNAKDLVSDLWLARSGHTHKLRMLISAKTGPYALYAALMGKPSWIDAAAKPAVRLGIFTAGGDGDLLRPVCDACGETVPAGLLGEPYAPDFCPRCADEVAGTVTAALVSRSHV